MTCLELELHKGWPVQSLNIEPLTTLTHARQIYQVNGVVSKKACRRNYCYIIFWDLIPRQQEPELTIRLGVHSKIVHKILRQQDLIQAFLVMLVYMYCITPSNYGVLPKDTAPKSM
jgi:hypothetical protein